MNNLIEHICLKRICIKQVRTTSDALPLANRAPARVPAVVNIRIYAERQAGLPVSFVPGKVLQIPVKPAGCNNHFEEQY
ncbi:hypothetical protein ACFL1S_01780 [Pseudomonadota bacterium]